jgi:tRNA(Ile)-lysidine synthase
LVRYLENLRDKKNLLAFSAGVDSTALFFLLLENDIEFDIAIVDYQKRESSKDEVSYAKELAKKYQKECFVKEVILEDSNFEHQARFERYAFFEEIIKTDSYKNLLTAHQLNDRVEWFLMQFTKGAGAVELLGFEDYEKRENYNLIRPLIEVTKEELLNYLHKHKIKYFEDKSNFEDKYKRNKFRKEYANKLLTKYEKGIKKSFEYLKIDKDRLFKLDILTHEKDFYLLKKSEDDIENLRAIDKIIKKLGVIISAKERDEILRQGEIVVAHKIAVALAEDKIYIAPYVESTMDKEFKEKCRVLKIPPKIRGYLWSENIIVH